MGTPPGIKLEGGSLLEIPNLGVGQGQPFERTGNKNRASERYPIPNKTKARETENAKEAKVEDKENLFVTPVATPRRSNKKLAITNQGPHNSPNVLSPSKSMDTGMNELEKTPGSKTPGKNGDYFATPSSRMGQNSTTPNKSG